MWNDCSYDHLAKVLTRVLDERPQDVVDIFEDVSKEVKKNRFSGEADSIQQRVDTSTEIALAEIQKRLFVVSYLISLDSLNINLLIEP